jgi:hypothetical protein
MAALLADHESQLFSEISVDNIEPRPVVVVRRCSCCLFLSLRIQIDLPYGTHGLLRSYGLIAVMVKYGVLFEVRTEFLNVI